MVDHTARMHLLVEQVIAIKADLDALDEGGPPVRPRPPASFERLAQARRAFEARGLLMPRDHERVLRAHDGIDHLWRTPEGSLSLFGHDELITPTVTSCAAGRRAAGSWSRRAASATPCVWCPAPPSSRRSSRPIGAAAWSGGFRA